MFTNIGGAARNNLAAIDVTSGLATSWDPNPSNAFPQTQVNALAVDGSLVYVGGNFGQIGGITHLNLAAVDASSGIPTAWDPNVIAHASVNAIQAIAVSGSTVYVAGNFSEIGGALRECAAALNATTAAATSWDPQVAHVANAIVPSGSMIYVGGDFASVNALPRKFVAAFDLTTGAATPWDPSANGQVHVLAVDGSTVYMGGDFTSVHGQPRDHLAAVDASTGIPTALNAGTGGGPVFALAVSPSTLYVGGNFGWMGGQTRHHLAAIDRATDTVTSWDPNATGSVALSDIMHTLTLSGPTLYVGGQFSSVGGQTRSNIAALDLNTGAATAWNPGADNVVSSIVVNGCNVYVGGNFHHLGGQVRDVIGALDVITGVPTSWIPTNQGSGINVLCLALRGATMYVGGDFGTLMSGGQVRNNIAAVDAETGALSPWNPSAGALVYSLAISSTTVYAGGEFGDMGGLPQATIAAIDRGGVVDPPSRHAIRATAGPNGSISPNACVDVNDSANKTFTITPDATYCVVDLLVDGQSVGSLTSYTFDHVTAEHTIAASFGQCPFGNIAGRVVADCPASGAPLLGVTVDAFQVGSGDLAGTAATDANGNYLIANLPTGAYTVTVVVPLGYTTAAAEQAVTLTSGTANANFALHCVAITANARSIGYWKHEVGVNTGEKGRGEYSATALCGFLDLINTHFNNNAINPVVVYQPPAFGTCADKLQVAKLLLNLQGSAAMIDRARQQFMALLMNVAAGFIGQQQVISADGATLSQAITYIDNLIDSPTGNYEKAKTIADLINNGQQVPAGQIPLGTQVITYSRHGSRSGGDTDLDFLVTPNPGDGVVRFEFHLGHAGEVNLGVFDVSGRCVATLVDATMSAGAHAVSWDATSRSGGVYFARLRTAVGVRSLRLAMMSRQR